MTHSESFFYLFENKPHKAFWSAKPFLMHCGKVLSDSVPSGPALTGLCCKTNSSLWDVRWEWSESWRRGVRGLLWDVVGDVQPPQGLVNGTWCNCVHSPSLKCLHCLSLCFVGCSFFGVLLLTRPLSFYFKYKPGTTLALLSSSTGPSQNQNVWPHH